MKKFSKKKKVICIVASSALALGAGVTAIVLGIKRKKNSYAAVGVALPWEEV